MELATKILLHEFKVTMALTGFVMLFNVTTGANFYCRCKNVQDISRAHLAIVDSSGVISKL